MDLGSLALKMSVDSSPLEAGLLKAEQRMGAFGGAVSNVGGQITKALDLVMAHPVAAVLVTAAAAAAALAGVTVGAVAELRSLADAGEKAGVAQANLSRKFGLTARDAGALGLASREYGIDSETASRAAVAFNEKLFEASVAGSAAESKLRQLGLTQRDLSGKGLTQQLGILGDALNKIPNAADRAGMAHEVLGRRARELEPLLKLGSAGLSDMAAKSQQWGLTFAAADAAAIKSANLAQRQAGIAVDSIRQSFANGIASAFAPAKQLWADAVTGLVSDAQPLFSFLRDGIGSTGAVLKDVVDGLRFGFAAVAEPIASAWSGLDKALDGLKAALGTTGDWRDLLRLCAVTVGEGIGRLLHGAILTLTDGIRYTKSWIDAFNAVDAAIRQGLVAALEAVASRLVRLLEIAGKLPDKLGGKMFRQAADGARGLTDVLEKRIGAGVQFQLPNFGIGGLPADGAAENRALKDSIEQATRALEIQNATFGMSSTAAKLYEFSLQGASAADLAAFKAASEHADVLKRLEAIKSPFEKWQDDVSKLNDLLKDGAMNAEQYEKLIASDMQKLLGSTKEVKLSNALQQGSTEAVSAINQANVARTDPLEQIKAIQEQQTKTQNETLEWIRRLAQATLAGQLWKKVDV